VTHPKLLAPTDAVPPSISLWASVSVRLLGCCDRAMALPSAYCRDTADVG